MSRRGIRGLSAVLGVLVVAGVPAVTASAAAPCPPGDQRPWCDRGRSAPERAALLTAALTEPEAITLLSGGPAGDHTGAIAAVPRLGIPTAYVTDGPVGVRQGPATALPTPLAEAASFDPGLARLHGATIGEEARRKGNDGVLAPTVNIMRVPRAGRTFEGFGEDPFLAARTAVGWIEGAQSRGVFATVKHFAANNQEGSDPTGLLSSARLPIGGGVDGSRYLQNSVVSERTLREIYLPAFEAAVREAHVGSVMCSYNRVNGPWACASKHLLGDVLGGWGFDGLLMSDWIFATHPWDTVAQLKAGLDLEMPVGVSYAPLLVQAALGTGTVTRAEVDARVRRILTTLFRFGFFDREPYAQTQAPVDVDAGDAAAERIAEGSAVLLENRGVLPLKAGVSSIAVIGPNAQTFITGGGSGSVTPTRRVSLAAGVAARAGAGVRTAVDDGSDRARAVALARASDVAVVAVGDYQTEGADKACLTLECPAERAGQDALVEAVAAAQPNTVVVLQSGGPVLLPWRSRVGALLETWYPGQAGGTAIARVLFGDVDPGGRLPVTFPQREVDLPTAGARRRYPGLVNQDVHYDEGVLVGYRWWDAKGLEPAYAFGFGRSYTTWRYRDLRVTPTDGGARVSVEVANTGTRTGSDVAQLYVGLPAGSGDAPRQLKGFRKLTLAAGKKRRVSFTVDERAVSTWAPDGWSVAPGCVRLSVGRSSRDLPLSAVVASGGAAACPSARVALGVRACASRRAVTITLPQAVRRGMQRVEVVVDGRRVRTVRGAPRRVRVSLAGHPRGTVRVRLVVHRRGGAARTLTRAYRTCTPRG
jgi:beta-glucosidase